MNFDIDFNREEDGRWIAEIDSLPGVMFYGNSKEEAAARVSSLASRLQLEAPSTSAAPGTAGDNSWNRSFGILEAARTEIRKHLVPGRDYLQEFLDERRLEAEHE